MEIKCCGFPNKYIYEGENAKFITDKNNLLTSTANSLVLKEVVKLNQGNMHLVLAFVIRSLVIALSFKILFVFSYEIQDTSDAMQYLARFGYIGKDTASSMNIIDASSVLKQFQHMAGINETGILDGDTMKMMNMPRCGNTDMEVEMIPDPDNDNSIKRRKRYKISDTKAKWKKRELTYRIIHYSIQRQVSREVIDRDVGRAFELWEGVTNLNFIRSNKQQVDIELSFATEKHRDPFPFDGPGKTLAHAFSPGPGLGGDVHFDDHEMWTVDSYKGTNVLFVAVHEIGHALGLSHSDVKGAIMQAFYGGYKPQLKLHPDDVAGIQHLYGKRETIQRPSYAPRPTTSLSNTGRDTNINFPNFRLTPNRRPTLTATWEMIKTPSTTTAVTRYIPIVTESVTLIPTTTPTTSTTTKRYKDNKDPSSPGFTRPDLCAGSSIDAITTLKDGNIYAFSGYYVFQINSKSKKVSDYWPRRIEYVFKGLEPNIDAAFTRGNGKTYFFKGGRYWRYDGFNMDSNYPKAISKHFPGIPDYIDSAFIYPLNQQIYFTKGDKYWRFDPTANNKPHVSTNYPISISLWDLSVPKIDAILDSPDESIYFFKDDKFWEFDKLSFKAKHHPKSLAKLFNCESKRFAKSLGYHFNDESDLDKDEVEEFEL